jgi:hemoglobin-like flavoprotein
MWTLEKGLSDAWTAEAAEAWAAAYDVLSSHMVEQAYDHPLTAESR